ncbi:hypothetical protein D3C75_474230 [compost metagenome]
MNKCILCNKGNLSQVGTSVICDNCNFMQFNVSSDYISACATVIATVASNKTFESEIRFEQHVQHWIEQHTPNLYDQLSRMLSGVDEFITMFSQDVLTHALNVTIEGEPASEVEEEDTSFVCGCGGTQPFMTKPGELICNDCRAKFKFDEGKNTYIPEFTCVNCGCNAINSDGVIAACDKCCTAYVELKAGGYNLI